MRISKLKVWGFENAMIGMRFPKNSDVMTDSTEKGIGKLDLELLLKLTKAGRDHRKALRMLHVQAAVDMPISWWIQYDTYKVATVANSRSRMHKLGVRTLYREDFYVEVWDFNHETMLKHINKLIISWQTTKDMSVWRRILDYLPMSYQQERMVDINYETLITILNSRYDEKLKNEWRFFCDSMLGNCPHLLEIWKVSK